MANSHRIFISICLFVWLSCDITFLGNTNNTWDLLHGDYTIQSITNPRISNMHNIQLNWSSCMFLMIRVVFSKCSFSFGCFFSAKRYLSILRQKMKPVNESVRNKCANDCGYFNKYRFVFSCSIYIYICWVLWWFIHFYMLLLIFEMSSHTYTHTTHTPLHVFDVINNHSLWIGEKFVWYTWTG